MDDVKAKGLVITPTILEGPDDRFPDWGLDPGVMMALMIGGVGDWGIVRAGAEPGQVILGSLATRKRRTYRAADVMRVRPLALLPPVPSDGLEKPVDGGWYQTSTGLVVVVERGRWWDPLTATTARLPLVPELVVRWLSKGAAKKEDEA